MLLSHDDAPGECVEQQLTARAVKFDVPDRPDRAERAERHGSVFGGIGAQRSTHGGVGGSAPSVLARIADDSTSAPAHPTLLPKGASTRLQRNARPAVMGEGAACVDADSAAPRELDADAKARPNRRGSVKPDVVPMLNTNQLASAGPSVTAQGEGVKAVTGANLQEAVAVNGYTERLVCARSRSCRPRARSASWSSSSSRAAGLAQAQRQAPVDGHRPEPAAHRDPPAVALRAAWSTQHQLTTPAPHAHGAGSGRTAAPSPPIMIDGRDHKSYGDVVTARAHYSSDELDLFNFDDDELHTARRDFTDRRNHHGAAAAASYHA